LERKPARYGRPGNQTRPRRTKPDQTGPSRTKQDQAAGPGITNKKTPNRNRINQQEHRKFERKISVFEKHLQSEPIVFVIL
jgi:hypothetical protein